MLHVISGVTKYILIFLIIIYSLQSVILFRKKTHEAKRGLLQRQLVTIFFFDFFAFMVLYLSTEDPRIIIMLLAMIIFFSVIQLLYRLLYKKASLLIVNNMCMLLSIGLVMIARLDFDSAIIQFAIAMAANIFALIIPVIIRKAAFLRRIPWLYAILGIMLLGVVLVLAQVSGGAKLSVSIGGFTLQLSEIVKITFVFFMASYFCENISFKRVVTGTIVAAIHVMILVLSTDLGTAAVFFITYVAMIYTATRQLRYSLLGLAGGALASVGAYFIFSHVRQRVVAWRDPFSVYDTSGYQIVQSLFAIGTGGWFGLGLYQGAPNTIPVARKDFMFSAICEEFGGIVAICLLLICMSMFLMVVNIAMKMDDAFYKLIALGFGTEYAFQVFLTVGGTSKLIPLTGITLPLVSYGGSSVLSTIIMLAIVQGLYIKACDPPVENIQNEAYAGDPLNNQYNLD